MRQNDKISKIIEVVNKLMKENYLIKSGKVATTQLIARLPLALKPAGQNDPHP